MGALLWACHSRSASSRLLEHTTASQAQQPLDTHLGEQTLGPTPRRLSHRLWAVYGARAMDSLPHFQDPSGAFSLAPSSASTTSLLTPCPVSLSPFSLSFISELTGWDRKESRCCPPGRGLVGGGVWAGGWLWAS